MNRPISRIAAAGIGLAMAAALAAQNQQLPVKDQKTADVSTPAGKFALEVTADYLGMASGKTVVRLRLASQQLTNALTKRGVRFVSGELKGTFSKGGEMVEAFRYPVSGDIDGGKAFSFSFLRPVPPGSYKVHLLFALPGGGRKSARDRWTSPCPSSARSSVRRWRRPRRARSPRPRRS